MKYKIVMKKSEEGSSVSCPGLPGCGSHGETEKQAFREKVRELYTIVPKNAPRLGSVIKSPVERGSKMVKKPKAKKQSTSKVSTLASKILSGSKKPTQQEIKSLAASVLSQDEKKGQQQK